MKIKKIPLIISLCCLTLIGCKDRNNSAQSVAPELNGSSNNPTLPVGLHYFSVDQLQNALKSGVSSEQLVHHYLNRIQNIDKTNIQLNSVLELNPDAIEIAKQLDLERKNGTLRGPLHGIPILIKGNIDTADKMQTTAGSAALVGQPPENDAFLVKQLRNAGVIILGKANLTEFSAMRDPLIPNGWSSLGGQTKNPHLLSMTPLGSSAGSAVAVAAGLIPISIGTETNGSIIFPSAINGVVGMRPSLGLISRAGIIPISSDFDTAGPIARNVKDIALLLNVLSKTDPNDAITEQADGKKLDFSTALQLKNLNGYRIGYPKTYNPKGNSLFEKSLAILKMQGAELVSIDNDLIENSEKELRDTLFPILKYDLNIEINKYLLTRKNLKVKSLADIHTYNERNPTKLPDGKIAPQRFLSAEFMKISSDRHREIKASAIKNAKEAIDKTLNKYKVDLLVNSFISTVPPFAGYPGISVPSGMEDDLPSFIYFFGTKWSDAKLISAAYIYEQATHAIKEPQYLKD